MELIKPVELDNDRTDWTGRVRHCDVWDTLTAARDGDVDRLKSLLDREAALARCEYWYVSPLHFAVREGHVKSAQLLIDRGADITLRTLYGEETFLQIAKDREHAELIDLLTDLARKHMSSRGEVEPIHEACQKGDIDNVSALIDADSKCINIGDTVGRRPIHYAIENQHTPLISLLLDNGADIDSPGFSSDNRLGGFGFRPISSALWYHPYWRQRNDYETAQMLIDHGSDYTITIAAALGDIGRVKELLAHDPSLCNHQEMGGKRALSAAAERNYVEIVETLLDAGAEPNIEEGPNCPRGYALWAASHFGYFKIAEMLLAHGADPNAPVESSGNPTESAFNADMRKLLYRHGGKVGFTQYFFENNVDAIAAILNNASQHYKDSLAAEGFPHVVSSGHETLLYLMLNNNVRVPPVLTGCQTYLWHNLELSEVLLKHEMDPNLPNWQSVRPLHHMAQKNNIEAGELFIRYGARPDYIDEEYRTTPLGWAAKYGSLEFANLLLKHFPDRSMHEPSEIPEWATPLAWAQRRGHEELIDLLS